MTFEEWWVCTKCTWKGRYSETDYVMYSGIGWQHCPSCNSIVIPSGGSTASQPEMIKCKCGGQLVLTKNRGTSWSSNMEGKACCPESWVVPGYVFCQICKTMFHTSILGKFRLVLQFPYYEHLTEEKCGQCRSFLGDNNKCLAGWTFRMRDKEACYDFGPK